HTEAQRNLKTIISRCERASEILRSAGVSDIQVNCSPFAVAVADMNKVLQHLDWLLANDEATLSRSSTAKDQLSLEFVKQMRLFWRTTTGKVSPRTGGRLLIKLAA